MTARLRSLAAAVVLTVAALLATAPDARAQQAGEYLRVYLITFGPGDAVWERFGHNAISVHDAISGSTVAYNWGMFSFDQPGFVGRLMKGRMLYWMEGFDTNAFVEHYIRTNRSVWVQELNLTPAQRVAMREFVEWNAREENKFYLYDYYRDNCSTRVRDAIDRVTGGALQRALGSRQTTSTYRSHTQALTYSDPLTYAGLMLAMGPRIDVPLSAWEEGFIPMELREWVREVNVQDESGATRPLVTAERTIFEAQRAPLAARAPNMVIPFTLAGILIAFLLLALGRLAQVGARDRDRNQPEKRTRSARIALAVLLAVLLGVLGVVGTVIALLWAATDHVVTYGNENILQANPLLLILAVLSPASVLGAIWARRWAAWLGLFVAGLSALGLLLQPLPGLDQVNGDTIGLLLPVHSGIAYLLWRRYYRAS